MLLAQLAANKKFNREEQQVDWYSFYHNVLENVGWVAKDFKFVKYNSSNASFSMDKVAIELLAAIATDDELLVIKGTLDALKKLGEGSGIVEMFKTQSYKYKAGNFQVSAVTMQNN